MANSINSSPSSISGQRVSHADCKGLRVRRVAASLAYLSPWLCFCLCLGAGPMTTIGFASGFSSPPASSFATAISDDGQQGKSEGGDDGQLSQRIDMLIEQLSAPTYPARESARWELERIGLAAFAKLREALTNSDIQIANSARYIIESQNVIWWLETDSAAVRRFLFDYNELEFVERETRLQELADWATDDAMLALCRLARFESNNLLSESAALFVMEKIAKQNGVTSEGLPGSILTTIDDSSRPAALWLKSLAGELTDSTPVKPETWQSFLKEQQGQIDGPRATQQRVNALRLYKWVGDWFTLRLDREQALATVKGSLKLIGSDPYSIRQFSIWALDSGLPELLPMLAEERAEAFESLPELRFLLAESFLNLDDAEAAEKMAVSAADLIDGKAEQIRQFRQISVNDVIANRHRETAIRLTDRGLFAWAEMEFQRALKLDMTINFEIQIRSLLAEFYWTAGDHRKAAEALKPLVERASESSEQGLPGRSSNISGISPYYYYYAGLAAIDEDNSAEAIEMLQKSADLEPNPDVVIAMYKLAKKNEYKTVFDSYYDEMVKEFRVLVARADQVLSETNDRMTRASISSNLAMSCNQLAWLLSNCEDSPAEAVSLSRRSLEFEPGNSSYLDTLGRCYYAAGYLEQAVEAQSQAVKLEPNDRLMMQQLRIFQAALAKKQQALEGASAEADQDS